MKKLLSLLLVTMMIIGIPSMAFAEGISQIIGDGNTVVFIDVPANYWARDQIEYFANQGIVDGYTDGSFKPEEGVTREEFCKLLVSTFRQPLENPSTPSFADVAENRWSYPYVEICKDFLTGYVNPFGGLPSFHPTEYATREDIAVALVRMMGFTDKDANNPNYATYNFRDGGNISPNILAYVSIACERGLISGYPDGTFGPTKGITRAETVVLLNRATKQAVTNINAELEISANVIYSSDKKTATINIVAEEGTTVTVNGESVKMSSNYYGEYEGNYVYKFEAEGSKNFAVEGRKAGKTKTLNVVAQYKENAPIIEVTECPKKSEEDNAYIKGTVTSSNGGSVKLTINGESVYVSYGGSWSHRINLKNGENKITIVATDQYGVKATLTRTIEFSPKAPTIEFYSFPETVVKKTVKLRGGIDDDYGSPTLTINGKEVDVSYWGDWEIEFELEDGENDLTFVVTSESGATTKVKKTICLNENAPEITVYSIDEETDQEHYNISGYISNPNDSGFVFKINDEVVKVQYSYWNHTLTLAPGNNDIIMEATNDLGRKTTVKRQIRFTPTVPILKINDWPTDTNESVVTIKGRATDENDDNIKVTVNGNEAVFDSYYSYRGEWSATVKLEPGKNSILIEAVNKFGKVTKKTVTVNCGMTAPTLKVTDWPQSTEEQTVTIKGNVSDGSDDMPSVAVNGIEAVVSNSGIWTAEIDLEEGINNIEIEACSKYGMTTKKQIKIEYVVAKDVETEDETNTTEG